MTSVVHYAVLGLAVLQIVTGYLLTIGGSSSLLSGGTSPLISPAGYAFSIWAPIVAGSLIYALYQLVSKRNARFYDRIAPWSALVFAGYSVWLYAAGQEWVWATVGIFLVMGYGLFRIFRVLAETSRTQFSLFERIAVLGTFGLYAGWATVAVCANLAAALLTSGAPLTGEVGVLWQAGILCVATIVSLIGMRVTQFSIAYSFAIVWAFVAIFVGLLEEGSSASYLPWVCGVGGLVLVLFYLRRT